MFLECLKFMIRIFHITIQYRYNKEDSNLMNGIQRWYKKCFKYTYIYIFDREEYSLYIPTWIAVAKKFDCFSRYPGNWVMEQARFNPSIIRPAIIPKWSWDYLAENVACWESKRRKKERKGNRQGERSEMQKFILYLKITLRANILNSSRTI